MTFLEFPCVDMYVAHELLYTEGVISHISFKVLILLHGSDMHPQVMEGSTAFCQNVPKKSISLRLKFSPPAGLPVPDGLLLILLSCI